MRNLIVILFIVLIFAFADLMIGQKVVVDQQDQSFSNITVLDVKGSFASVDVQSHSSETVDFLGEITSYKERDDVRIEYEIKGETLLVWIERPNFLSQVKGRLEFKVPKTIKLIVSNSSGSVMVNGIANEEIILKSSSGSIMASEIVGKLSLVASSGGVKATHVVGDVVATTSSGAIYIGELVGDVKSNSSSGGQKVMSVVGDVSVQSSSGGVKFESIQGDIIGVTSSGGIGLVDVKGALNITSSSGSQRGVNVMLTADSFFKSNSGSIKMDLSNSSEELSFNLGTSSGSLSADGEHGKKRLETGVGTILVKGRSGSGSQSYY